MPTFNFFQWKVGTYNCLLCHSYNWKLEKKEKEVLEHNNTTFITGYYMHLLNVRQC